MTAWAAIADHISQTTGEPFEPASPRSLGGGCINTAARLSDGAREYFVKLNRAHLLDMFEAESDGLAEMAATRSIRVPQPLCYGIADGDAYLVMEYIALGRHRSDGAAAEAGRQLARMHRQSADAFGWHRDNTIGSTPQHNAWMTDWVEFWRERRLGFQLRLAAEAGYRGSLQRRGERLLAEFDALIDHAPVPSLLHGDLWGGNMSYDSEGRPVIYDPAVYYGDREADIAMTELFGGFDHDFHAAYDEAWPLDPGYRVRRDLYNLYHILNHLNLFGRGYLGQAQRLIDRLLAEIC